MALQVSTGMRDFTNQNGSLKRALEGGSMRIYSGSAPATADAAATGTLLSTITVASGALTEEVLAQGTVTVTGTSGTMTSITVNGYEVLGATITFLTDLTTTAALVAAQINKYGAGGSCGYTATSAAAVVTLTAVPNTGTSVNGDAVVSTEVGGDLGGNDVNVGTTTAGVDQVNGLTWGTTTSGVLSKAGTWSGVNAASGTAGYFRFYGSEVDADALSTVFKRIQGTCGTSGADYNMDSTALTVSATHTIDGGSFTEPAS